MKKLLGLSILFIGMGNLSIHSMEQTKPAGSYTRGGTTYYVTPTPYRPAINPILNPKQAIPSPPFRMATSTPPSEQYVMDKEEVDKITGQLSLNDLVCIFYTTKQSFFSDPNPETQANPLSFFSSAIVIEKTPSPKEYKLFPEKFPNATIR